MKNKNNRDLVLGILFLIAAIINLLNVDFNAPKFLELLSPILNGLGGILFINQFLKERKEDK